MSYQGTEYRPPLPPRSPRTSFGSSSTPGPPQFPPPPPVSPFTAASLYNPHVSGPPIPPRPQGLQPSPSLPAGHHVITPSSSPLLVPPAHGRPGYSGFPAPPVSPNRAKIPDYMNVPPPLPPRNQPPVPEISTGSHQIYAPNPPAPTLTPSALSPEQLTSFPPPPPGPPSRGTTPLKIPSHTVPQLQHSIVDLPASNSRSQQGCNGGFRSKFPLPPGHPMDPEIPSSPPPAYTPVAAPGSRVPIATLDAPQKGENAQAFYQSSSTENAQMINSQVSSYKPSPSATFTQSAPSPDLSLPSNHSQMTSIPSISPVTAPTSGSASGNASVSNPQSPDAISFFPRVSPMMPQRDPIEELMQSVSISTTPASEASPYDRPIEEGLYSPLSTPVDDVRQSPGFTSKPVAPLRPPKTPVSDSSPAPIQRIESFKSSTSPPSQHMSQFKIPRKPCASPAPRPSSVVTSCVDTPMTFVSTWYSHPGAPDFLVCLRCYMDHIFDTKFASAFEESISNDGKPRVCRFSKSRIKDHIFPRAVATSYLQPLIDYMRRRSAIPDCRGADGVLGSVASTCNIKWYNTTDNSIPGFLACEACYEDYAACYPGLSSFFQPHPQAQSFNEVWACDFALTFIQKQYEIDTKVADPKNGWSNFAFEAKARLGCSPCGQVKNVRSRGKKWFQPIAGPAGVIICAACYCDQVIHTGEESKWRVVPDLTEAHDMQVRCAIGGRFNIRLAMARAHEVKDFSVFWNAMKKLENHPLCQDEGIQDGQWWTLPNQPEEFQICGACYDAICQPLGIERFFKEKSALSGAAVRCCFNITHPRLRNYMPRLLELYFTHDPTALVEYAAMYAAIPPCGKDEARSSTSWYGWDDCRICSECFHDFAKQHRALSDQMTLKNTWIQEDVICEMYSARMRQLYLASSKNSPPDVSGLLHFSRHRRQVYYQTVPQIKQIIQQQKLALGQQRMLNTLSSFHTNSGQLQQITYGSAYMFSTPGVGSFYTMDALQGAQYKQQAMGVMAGAQGAVGTVQALEQQWRAVE